MPTTVGSPFETLQARIRETLLDGRLTCEQRVAALARHAESALPYPALPPEAREHLASGIVCDLAEGHAPYRPRYVLPDYARYLARGSQFLEVEAPGDLDEALNALAILYRSVPSITGYPVYLGDLDSLLEPFAAGVPEADLEKKLRLFLRLLDRTCQDGFVHAVLGPRETRVGHACLAAERALRQVVPNWTVKVDPDLTTDALLLDAVRTCLEVSKPHFLNHPAACRDLGPEYSVASCYNTLPRGGGSHTLVRLNLPRLVQRARKNGHGVARFLEDDLPRAARSLLAVVAARITFLVEEARFFETSFLAREHLVSLDRFTAMFGMVGLAEAVDLLRDAAPGDRYGHSEEALELARAILSGLDRINQEIAIPYCEATRGHALLHAQAGISEDDGVTAGARIPSGTEPGLLEHVRWAARVQPFFPSGVSDPMHFDETVRANPQAVVDVLRGAFRTGMREFTFSLRGGEFVRVTGYLVRRSDLERHGQGEASRYDTTALSVDPMRCQGVDRRIVHEVASP